MVVVGHSWHANRHTSGQLSFEGSWILLLNNNSRRECIKFGSVGMRECGSDTCKMREIVRVISRILHMVLVNGDPSQELIKCRNGVAEILRNYC